MYATSVLEPEIEVRPFETCSFLWGNYNYLLRQPVQILSARQDGLGLRVPGSRLGRLFRQPRGGPKPASGRVCVSVRRLDGRA